MNRKRGQNYARFCFARPLWNPAGIRGIFGIFGALLVISGKEHLIALDNFSIALLAEK